MLIPSSLQNSYSSIKEIKEVSMPNKASLVVQGRPWPSTTGILSTVIALSAPWTGTERSYNLHRHALRVQSFEKKDVYRNKADENT